jgi:hypothetical protein
VCICCTRVSFLYPYLQLTNRHAGNLYFRQLCQSSKPPAYRALTKLAKRNLALSIISVIEQRPGRFLAQKAVCSASNTSATLEWVELTLDEKLTRTLLVLQRDTAEPAQQHSAPTALSSSSPHIVGLIVVHPHDVLSGSGQFTNQHAGNIHFRQLGADLRPANYPQLNATAKRNVALQVIAAVQGSGGDGDSSSRRRRTPPGRFLAQHNGRQLLEWVELDAAETMAKTLETLKYVERARQKKRQKQQQPGENGSVTVRHQTNPTIYIDSGGSIKTETTEAKIAKRVKCA